TYGEVGDIVVVHYIEMDDIGTCLQHPVDLLTQASEIGGQDGGGNSVIRHDRPQGDDRNRSLLTRWSRAVGSRSANAVVAAQPLIGLLDLMNPLAGGGQLGRAGSRGHQLVRMMAAEHAPVGPLDLFRAAVQLHTEQGRRLLQSAGGRDRSRAAGEAPLVTLAQSLLLGPAQAGPLGPPFQQLQGLPMARLYQRHAPAPIQQLGAALRLLAEQSAKASLHGGTGALASIEVVHCSQPLPL